MLRIFGPNLFYDETGEHFDVEHNIGEEGENDYFFNDIYSGGDDGSVPGPLSYVWYPPGSAVPEPASFALLSLGGLAMLRRTRD